MIILGINCSPHDRSVAIFKNGKLIYAIEEERITKEKHSISYDQKFYNLEKDGNYFEKKFLNIDPAIVEKKISNAISYCLGAAGLKESDIDIYVSSNLYPFAPFQEKSVYISHHLAHAATTFYLSGLKEAAILVADGAGNGYDNKFETISFYKGKGNKIVLLKKYFGSIGKDNSLISISNSLGTLYKNTSAILGFGNLGEGKMMGMASYGIPRYIKLYKKHIIFKNGELLIRNKEIYLDIRLFYEKSKHKGEFQFKADLAASCQEVFNEILLNLVNHLYEIYSVKSICLSGGCFLNAFVNSRIFNNSKFKSIFIPSAPGDNGVSIGAGLYIHNLNKKVSKQNNGVYLGKSYLEVEILKALKKNCKKIRYEKIKNIEKVGARYLSNGFVIGWFQGRAEFGPRALGNRSILASPVNKKMKDYINGEIKFRENFRPLAPAIILEHAKDYFELGKLQESKWMLFVAGAKEVTKKNAPAIVHVDGTARIQTVQRSENPKFYKLIREFFQITGVPILLNTSFNLKNQPIVEAPQDAVEMFLKSKLDLLIIGNYLIKRNDKKNLYYSPFREN